MARVSGQLVMTGNRDGEFVMNVEFSDAKEAHPLRIRGYYLGNRTSAGMIEELTKRASTAMDESKPDVTGNVGDGATGSGDEVRTVDSQSSIESLKVSTPGSSLMDTARVGDPPTGAGFCRAEHSLKEEISLREEDTIKEEDTKKEEDSSKWKITCKEEDTTKQEDVKKEEDSSKGETNLKEEHIKKEEDAKKEMYSLKGEFTIKEEDTIKEEGATKEEGSAKGVSAKEEGTGNEVSGKSPSVVGLQPHLDSFPDKFVSGPLRPNLSSADEVEKEVEVDDYFVFAEDVSTPVSLCVLPLELEEGKTIGGSGSTKVLSLHSKSVGVDITWLISAWKLTFLENASFQILVKMVQKGDAKWIKLGEPRSPCKETLEDVFLVAKILALLKKEPQASEDRVWHHLLEGDVAPGTLRDHLRMRCPLMEQFINLDPILKEANARKTLLALLDRDKEENSGKRVLSDRDSSDEVENRPGKKFKTGNVFQKNEKLVGVTSSSIPEDTYMGEFDGEEEYYDEGEGDESDEEFGDSCCIFCDDGGILLCCDGPCMRSFHATKENGIHSQCTTLGLTEAVVARLVGKWLCKNCKYNQHQCYVCGELGSASNEDLGARQGVFVCNVACCGRFYHPKCIANRLTVDPSAKETLAENIQAGKESFTCPLHACNECGEGENRDVSDLTLVKCRRCPKAWHKKCLPRNILFEEEARKRNVEIRAWTFGEKKTQLICYCTDHKIIGSLGTPSRKHLNFGLSPEEVKEKEEFEKQQKKVSAVMKEPARYGTKTSPMAASMGKSTGKKYRSTELIAKPRPGRLIGSTSVPPPKPRISKDAVKTCEEAAERTVDFIVTQSKLKVTEDSVKSKHESNLPGIYKPKRNGFMKMGMVVSILEAAKAAVEKLLLAKHVEAVTICDKKTVQTVLHEEERLRTYLAPTLFGKRYTSYGRHFTKLQKLEKVVEILQPYIWDRDTIVDFSCGDNSFCRLFREALSEARKTNCQFKNFDIFPSKDTFGFEQKDWLQVGLKDCGPGENLVIGLNPPFAFVEKFVSHALGMNPRLLVLIVPPMKKNLEHLGYECLVDDDSLMAEKSFYLPGSVNEKSMECLEQGNNVAPHFFIYCHKKFVGRLKGGVPMPPEGPSTANRSSMIRKIEMPAKLPPPSEPTASLFIPSVPPRPLPSQVPGKVAPRNRDPRLYLGVSSGVSRPVGPDSPEEGELPSPQGHLPFRNNNPRPVWHNNLPPPPPYPPHLHMRALRHQPIPFPPHTSPLLPHHHHQGEYSPFEPGMFPRGSPYLVLPPPVRPSQNGFQRGPRQEEFLPGPSPSRYPEFRPEDDNGYGGWIDG